MAKVTPVMSIILENGRNMVSFKKSCPKVINESKERSIRQNKIISSKHQKLNYSTMTPNQCCGSGMFIPDPDFYPSRIPDLKTVTKERVEKKFVVITFFVDTNFTKL
jgi:hypothetical protein